jgi:alpha-acetolactate decarboxylase
VVIYDRVAYHQGTDGTKVLTGQERTPFMTVTTFNKAWCREVGTGKQGIP